MIAYVEQGSMRCAVMWHMCERYESAIYFNISILQEYTFVLAMFRLKIGLTSSSYMKRLFCQVSCNCLL